MIDKKIKNRQNYRNILQFYPAVDVQPKIRYTHTILKGYFGRTFKARGSGEAQMIKKFYKIS